MKQDIECVLERAEHMLKNIERIGSPKYKQITNTLKELIDDIKKLDIEEDEEENYADLIELDLDLLLDALDALASSNDKVKKLCEHYIEKLTFDFECLKQTNSLGTES